MGMGSADRIGPEKALMITRTSSVILLDEESPDNKSVLDALAQQGFRCERTASPHDAAGRLDKGDFDALIAYQRAAPDGLEDFVGSVRASNPNLAIIVVQTEYDGHHECRLFDLDVDDVVTCDYPANLLAFRTVLRARNRREMIFP